MGKREVLFADLKPLFDRFRSTGIDAGLRDFVVSNSNLPGPRGNIELGLAFSDIIAAGDPRQLEHILGLCASWSETGPDDAPGDGPAVMVPFCGTLGAAGVASLARNSGAGRVGAAVYDRSFELIMRAAEDTRWRVREACAMALQRHIFVADTDALDRLEAGVESAGWLELRAFVAAIADFQLRGRQVIAERGIAIHERILERVAEELDLRGSRSTEAPRAGERRTDIRGADIRGADTHGTDTRRRPDHAIDDGLDVLLQGLSFSLSVVVAESPKSGFPVLARFARSQHREIRKVIRENLKKTRLARPFSDEVAAIVAIIDAP